MKLSLFNIVNFRVDGGAMFGVIPKPMWNRTSASDENNTIALAIRSLVVETEGRVILFDAGWGDKQDEKFFRYTYLHGGEGLINGLAGCGYVPGNVTDVVLTHLHADHCGGCFRTNSRGLPEPVFPSAVYHVSRDQWEWANKNNLREEDAFLPENIIPIGESGRLHLINRDEWLTENIFIKLCYGHTPGLMVPYINSRDRTFIYTGDLIPTIAHIPLLWNMAYDLDPLATIREKQEVLGRAMKEKHILIFQHDIEAECCSLVETEKGIRAGDTGLLSNYL